MGDQAAATLAEFVEYLPRVQRLKLGKRDLRAIQVRAEPPSEEEFLSLGDLLPGAPPIGQHVFPTVGARQIFVARSDAPPQLWYRLAKAVAPHNPSGTGGTGMFGNDDERWVDEENPELGWRRFNAGQQTPLEPPER